MEAIKRTHVKRNGKELIVILPESFTAAEVDVLIWPSDEETEKPNENISPGLLKWPQMTDEEFSSIVEKRKHLNAWK